MTQDIKSIPPLTPEEREKIKAQLEEKDPTWARCEECGCGIKKSDKECKTASPFCPVWRT